ncbi:MAG TPA: hypothetical protein PKE69_01990 [Pyrinomonadaceae bacterium]|mgnify:CR=1 FL=1|nr:hypothetical protein [Pyrinomonadaceae bacterium]
MEILIVGLVIVALMVYGSTKLKKYTAAQFEREEIDEQEFSLVKPEGFLHVLNESKFAFYAYSKEFGKAEAEEMRQAEIFIEFFADKTLAEVCEGIKTSAEKIVYFEDEGKEYLIETEKTVDEIVVDEIYKIVEGEKIYQLKISVLNNIRAEYEERIETISDSFRIK